MLEQRDPMASGERPGRRGLRHPPNLPVPDPVLRRSERHVELARYMGTSVEMIDRTYGHLAKGAEDSARAQSWTLTRDVWAKSGPRAPTCEERGKRKPPR